MYYLTSNGFFIYTVNYLNIFYERLGSRPSVHYSNTAFNLSLNLSLGNFRYIYIFNSSYLDI